MDNQNLAAIIGKMFAEMENLIPVYMQNPEDKDIAGGNVAVCVIDENGLVYGRMFGTNKPRLRH
jgi:glc operon protein GlcG